MDNNRIAEIGDLLLERVGNFRYVGIIYKITADEYYHKTVFVKWTKPPNCYREKRGYAASNIHNQRNRFDLEKGCKSVI